MKSFSQESIQAATQGLRAIAHELRLTILCHLSAGPMNVSELLEAIGASQSNLSQHLAKMHMLGLLSRERRSQQVYYRLSDPAYLHILDALKSVYCPERCADPPDLRP